MRLSTRLMMALSIVLVATGCGGGGGDVASDADLGPDADPGPDAFVCSPGEFLGCTGADEAQHCDDDGAGVVELSCDFGCNAERGGCNACTPSTTECHGDELVQCGASGEISETRSCELGCEDSGEARCFAVAPSNLPPNICDDPPRQDFVVGAGVLDIDTDNSSICEFHDQDGGPGLCVIRAERVSVERLATMRARGQRALVVVAREHMTVSGLIDARAEGSSSGPGAPTSAGNGQSGEFSEVTQAGGGGGYGEDGGSGASNVTAGGGGSGGISFGGPALTPLRGGSAGGDNGASPGDLRHAAGGGGGGAVHLVACGEPGSSGEIRSPSLVIDGGGIHAGGGGGAGGGGAQTGSAPGAGAGGGSGGAILLEAPSVSIDGVLAANGGAGGGGGTTPDIAGMPGQDGHLSAFPALGGDGGGASHGGNRGIGTGAEAGSSGDNSGGGGGGGAGRVRINVGADVAADIDGATISPPASEGTVAIR